MVSNIEARRQGWGLVMSKTHTEAILHNDFVDVFDSLLSRLFLSNAKFKKIQPSISPEKIKKATWLASIAALGSEDRERNLSSAYGALLHLYDQESEVYKRACYVLQSRTGNIVSSSHLPKIFSNNQYTEDFGSLLNIELAGNRALLNKVFHDESEVFFTKFQSALWDSLVERKNIAISAPTSAGKSFIIKKYISEIVSNGAKKIIFIVPTKALINQVSNDIKFDLKDSAHVFTSFRDVQNDKANIFVLTPERSLKIFQDEDFTAPDLVFMDEAHNIEDNSRGAVFENSLYRMICRWPSTQFVVAGPFIEELSRSIKSVADINLLDHKTHSTPVFQLKTVLTLSPRSKEAKYKIASPTGNILKGTIDLKASIYSKAKNNKGDALAAIMEIFSPEDHNIIYAPRRIDAEGWAKKVAPVIGGNNPNIIDGADQRVKDLIDFLADEVHPNYSLIRTLRLGVAYHHAGLPDIARQEIEELYSQSLIKNIVCTSTLIQGVNLPADRLIVINPKVNSEPLTDFEFFNLIGRAGRVSTKLFGEVYCIDIADEEWGEERITTDVKKTVTSSTTNSINKIKDDLKSIIFLDKYEIDDDSTYRTVAYLRSLFQSDKNHFYQILASSDVDKENSVEIVKSLKELSEGLTIPDDLLGKNPFVDPILQDKLYKKVVDSGVEEWLISKNPYSKKGENKKDIPFDEKSYYYQFWSVMERLNDIFDIEREMNSNVYNFDDFISIGLLVKDSHAWMRGRRHRNFIENLLDESTVDEKKVDKAARYVTSHISRNITFISVKYMMIWSDIITSFLTDEEIEEHAYILNLSTMLEMGSYDSIVLELMSLGINRSIALKIKKFIVRKDISVEDALKQIDRTKLSSLFGRYLNRAGYG